MPRVSDTELWCTVCEKQVHQLSAMPESEARALLRAEKGRICIGYEFDRRGRVLFRDRPPPAPSRTTLALAGLALALTLAMSGCLGLEREEPLQQPDDYADEFWTDSQFVSIAAPELPPEPPPAKHEVEHGELFVVVVDETDESPIADVAVAVDIGESGVAGLTSAEGTWQFDLEPGTYSVEVVTGQGKDERWIYIEAGDRTEVTFRIDESPVKADLPPDSRRSRREARRARRFPTAGVPL